MGGLEYTNHEENGKRQSWKAGKDANTAEAASLNDKLKGLNLIC